MSVFNPIQHARELRAAGVPEAQAEVHAETMGKALNVITADLVTRAELRAELDITVMRLKAELEPRFARIERDLRINQMLLAMVAAATVVPALSDLLAG